MGIRIRNALIVMGMLVFGIVSLISIIHGNKPRLYREIHADLFEVDIENNTTTFRDDDGELWAIKGIPEFSECNLILDTMGTVGIVEDDVIVIAEPIAVSSTIETFHLKEIAEFE